MAQLSVTFLDFVMFMRASGCVGCLLDFNRRFIRPDLRLSSSVAPPPPTLPDVPLEAEPSSAGAELASILRETLAETLCALTDIDPTLVTQTVRQP